jgi:hypothetical protein
MVIRQERESDYPFSKQIGVATCAFSKNSVPVVGVEFINDVFTEIMSYERKGLFIYERYETLPQYRLELIDSIIMKMIVRDNMLANPNSDVSLFIRDKFSDCWNKALNTPR